MRCPDAQLWLSSSNFARNSHAISSNIESTSLELQRFRVISKSDRGEITCDIYLAVVSVWPAWAVGAARLGSVLLASLGALARCPAHPCRPRVAPPGPLVPPTPTSAWPGSHAPAMEHTPGVMEGVLQH